MKRDDEIKRPEEVIYVPNEHMYPLLRADLEERWLEDRRPVWLYLLLIDEAWVVLNRPRPVGRLHPVTVEEMKKAIAKDRFGRLWARDWRLMFLYAEQLDEGGTLAKFAEEHAADGESPSNLEKRIAKLMRHAKWLTDRLGERVHQYPDDLSVN